jgi:L-rhamnose mutarotase
MRRLLFALDLKDDPTLIAEYEAWHQPERIWPEIPQFLRTAGIRELEIFRSGDRLVMVMEVPEDFSAEQLAKISSANERVRAWEALMWKFQRPLPFARPGEKWVPMSRVFSLQQTLKARRHSE